MPAVPSNRSWLPEMLEELERCWNRSLAWEEYAALCVRLTELRTRLRRERGVRNPRMVCRRCGEMHEMVPGPVTIRSVLFALARRGVLTGEELERMDTEWRRYRSKHRLDGRGKSRAEPDVGPNKVECEESPVPVEPQRHAPPDRSS